MNTSGSSNSSSLLNPWALELEQESLELLENNQVAFIFFTTLGATLLLTCLVALCRQAKRRNSCLPRECGQCSSCLCVAFFFGMLAAGFLTLGTYNNEETWSNQYDDGHGQVRITDTRVVSDNLTIHVGNSTFNKTSSIINEFIAQVRVTFGGEWACGNDLNETLCDGFVVIPQCNKAVCVGDPKGVCSQIEIETGKEHVQHCLAGIVGDYELPIDNATFDPFVSPELDPNYPNIPLIEGYWNCERCSFIDVAGYEEHQPTDSLKTTGIGLLCGAALVLCVWVLVMIIKWIVFPDVQGDFNVVGSNINDWEHADNWVSMPQNKRRKFNARKWVRSKQWTMGSPIPEAYSYDDSDDDDDDFGSELEMVYGKHQQRDGLEKIDESTATNGNGLHVNDSLEEDDEVPDYWVQWNTSNKPDPP